MTTATPNKEPHLSPKQRKFRTALAEQMDVLRIDNLPAGVVRMVILPQGDLPVEIESVNIPLPQGNLVRYNVGIDCRVKGFVVSPGGDLLGVQEMSNKDLPNGKPQWLAMDYDNKALLALQDGLR